MCSGRDVDTDAAHVLVEQGGCSAVVTDTDQRLGCIDAQLSAACALGDARCDGECLRSFDRMTTVRRRDLRPFASIVERTRGEEVPRGLAGICDRSGDFEVEPAA